MRQTNPMFSKFFNAKTLTHVVLAAVPFVATSMAHLPGAYGVVGSALLQLFALYSKSPSAA
jgi:hypothetical protein